MLRLQTPSAGDGACSHQGLPVARAGCGAYFGPEHRLNFAFALEGPLQDSDRAELRTLVRVARWTPSATEYLTDNEAVLLGFAKLLEGHSQPWNDHHDLWHALGQVLHSRGWDLLRVSFVKGHATELDVALGRASPREVCGTQRLTPLLWLALPCMRSLRHSCYVSKSKLLSLL